MLGDGRTDLDKPELRVKRRFRMRDDAGEREMCFDEKGES